MGRVLLAGLDPPARAELLDRIELRALAHDTVTTRAQLEQELERVRAQGHAIVDQELESGLRSVAAPIRDRSSRPGAGSRAQVSMPRATSHGRHSPRRKAIDRGAPDG